MTLQACIFDLDGVIVDTAKYHYIAWKQIAGELGFEFSEKHNERLKGVSRIRSLEILLEVGNLSLDEKTKNELAERKNNLYLQYIHQLTPADILPGSEEFLKEHRDNNIKTALGSASKNAMLILERLGIITLFDVIIDGNKALKAKPDPDVFEKAATELQVPYQNCIVFEDAEAGIDAAIRAGMKCVGVGDIQTLYKANWVINGFQCFNLNKLLEMINGLKI
jgi:beta-phosphoglucomutase